MPLKKQVVPPKLRKKVNVFDISDRVEILDLLKSCMSLVEAGQS
jgi:hypothetical protein